MNDLNKTDLREIYRCLKYMTKGGITPYSCHTIALCKKIHNMINNYCDHEWHQGKHLFNDIYCVKCNKHFEVNDDN